MDELPSLLEKRGVEFYGMINHYESATKEYYPEIWKEKNGH